MSSANPRWGSPRIVGELAKLGIHVAKATAERYMVRPKKPPSPTWRAFLDNHVKDLVSVDFFVVPTVTFRVLFVFIVLAHARRRILHFDVTEHPTAQWTTHQISEAFPWESAPRYPGTATASTGWHSGSASSAWGSKKSSPPLGVPGRTPSSSG